MAENEPKKKEEKKVIVPKTAADVQRLKIEKLMKNPKKPVVIAEALDEKQPRVFTPPEFIRNIWGSSAGAGSGDFHVYRGIRRREYARQKFIDEKAKRDAKDQENKNQAAETRKVMEEKVATKRARRLKKKAKLKAKKQKLKEDKRKGKGQKVEEQKSDSEDDDDEEEEDEKTEEKTDRNDEEDS